MPVSLQADSLVPTAHSSIPCLTNCLSPFSRSGPELINGRLAMLGFVAAVGAELSSHESVLRQLADEPTGIAAVFGLIIAGSLAPLLLGSK